MSSQPAGQTCSVVNGSGTIGSANVANAVVTCDTIASYVGGTISGLSSSGLVLENSGANPLTVSAGTTSFTMPVAVAYGSSYAIAVQTQPTGQTCTVNNGSATMPANYVTNVAVICSSNSYTLSGSITGLGAASGLVLANGSSTQSVAANATGFTMPASVTYGAAYNVTVQANPSGLTCGVSGGSGTMVAGNVTNIAVTCSSNTHTVGGSVSGLATNGLVLANGGTTVSVNSGATTFTFPGSYPSGGAYRVTIQTQPTGYSCSLSNASGTLSANVSNVTVSCAANKTIGGTISGLGANTGLVLANNGSDATTIAANATQFTMNTGLGSGASYVVTVQSSPSGMTCTVSNGSGMVASSNINNVSISCASNGPTVTTYASGLNAPTAIAQLPGGDLVVADKGTHKISRVSSTGAVTLIAGSGLAGAQNATAQAASFNAPTGMAVDANGNIFVSDQNNHLIRKVTTAGVVTTYAGNGSKGFRDASAATQASFSFPVDVAVDSAGNVYVADFGNNRIRKISTTGAVSTLAGTATAGGSNGPVASATFTGPTGVAVDSTGRLFVSEFSSNRIRLIDTSLQVSTYAGTGSTGAINGAAGSASFSGPYHLAVDGSGNVFVADTNNELIRKISAAASVSTYAGVAAQTYPLTNGQASSATFNGPSGVFVDSTGAVFVADQLNGKVRKIAP